MTPSDETAVHKGLVASRVVEALCKGRGATIDDLASTIGMTRSTLYNRLAKGDWKFTELVAIAEVLDEPFSSFIDGMGGRFLRPVGRPAVSDTDVDSEKYTGGKTRRCSELVAA